MAEETLIPCGFGFPLVAAKMEEKVDAEMAEWVEIFLCRGGATVVLGGHSVVTILPFAPVLSPSLVWVPGYVKMWV